MSQNAFTPSEDLQQFQEIVEALFQATFYENVVNVSLNALESSMSIDNVDRAMLVGLAAGYLIDAGKRLHDEEAIRKGTKFLETHYDSLRRFLSQPHLEYNIGNGKTGLFDLSRRQRDFRYVPRYCQMLWIASSRVASIGRLTTELDGRSGKMRVWPSGNFTPA
jgi:hypothetical protein